MTWSGIRGATETDLLVLSCDVDGWPLDRGFDAVSVSAASGHASGPGPSGWALLPPLIDLRCPYILRYVRAESGGAGTVLAQARLGVDLPTEAMQVHLGYTDRRDEMLVLWVSEHASPAPQVRWGLTADNLTRLASGSSSTYVFTCALSRSASCASSPSSASISALPPLYMFLLVRQGCSRQLTRSTRQPPHSLSAAPPRRQLHCGGDVQRTGERLRSGKIHQPRMDSSRGPERAPGGRSYILQRW